MITHRILEDFYEDQFRLFAIHSNVEDFSMAYALNQALRLRLSRSKEDHDLNEHLAFPYFEWKDELQDVNWHLLSNTSVSKESHELGDLFPGESTGNRHYLIPEYKDADYVLRTETDREDIVREISNAVLAIPHVITVYEIDTTELKSKENLIL